MLPTGQVVRLIFFIIGIFLIYLIQFFVKYADKSNSDTN